MMSPLVKKISLISASVLVVAGLITGAWLIGRSSKEKISQAPSPLLSPSPSPSPSVGPVTAAEINQQKRGTGGTGSTTTQAGNGTVEGSLVYPSQAIPADLRVCAINLAGGGETCSGEHVPSGAFKNGQGYRLSLPAGSYRVYAVVPSFDPNYRAYYSAFVTCGYSVNCTDHSPLTVTVAAGQTVTGIEPGDFYAP